jgi:hypothetical protein
MGWVQTIVLHQVAHEDIAQIHIPLYFFGALEGLNNKTSTIHQCHLSKKNCLSLCPSKDKYLI